VSLAAAAAGAAFDCRFDHRCVEDAPCTAADLALSVSGEAGPGAARLATGEGARPATLSVTPGGATFVLALGEDAIRLLSLGAGGTARYTLHISDGPRVVTYLGRCRPAETARPEDRE
jgi:hypothetical protein